MKVFNSRLLILTGLTIFLLFGAAKLSAQHIQISANYAQGLRYNNNWDLFNGGAELSADYIFDSNDLLFNSGLDLRTIQWGNQLSISLGIAKKIGDRFELGAEIQNGLALFYRGSLYVLGVSIKGSYSLLKTEKMNMGLSLEARYSNCPAYKDYGQIYHVVEIQIGLYIRF